MIISIGAVDTWDDVSLLLFGCGFVFLFALASGWQLKGQSVAQISSETSKFPNGEHVATTLRNILGCASGLRTVVPHGTVRFGPRAIPLYPSCHYAIVS